MVADTVAAHGRLDILVVASGMNKVAKIDEMLTTGVAPFPAERTMIVNGILESCLRSKHGGHKKLKTPHLDVFYQAPRESHHAQD